MFNLDPRLAESSFTVTDLTLCTVRLVNDCAFPWLLLIPGRNSVQELTDLTAEEQHCLIREIDRATRILQTICTPDKINIGTLGNIVPQMHVHVIARRRTDRAWPGPVWGSGEPQAYAPVALETLLKDLRLEFTKTAV